MYKIGLSSIAFSLNEESFVKLKGTGIDAIEISLEPECYPDICYNDIKRWSDLHNIMLWSYHLPFSPFSEIDLSSKDDTLRKGTISYYSELIKKAADIGFDKFIVHPSAEPIEDDERADRLNFSMDSLNQLAEIAFSSGATIAVEDLPRTCLGHTAEEIITLISANDKLRVCLDANHLLIDNNINFMDQLRDKIITLHISDYDFINERHWLPGEGKVDWLEFYNKLKEINYNGVWMYEVPYKAPNTIIRDRDLVMADFYNNANSIFANEIPKPIGTPLKNLGMYVV